MKIAIFHKQEILLIMESGRVVKWTGLAENKQHAEGLATAYATSKYSEQVWDMCNRPVTS